MVNLTHGSDMMLAPTAAPIVKQSDLNLRGALERLALSGFETVQLDATLSGIRPRELDRRARQDLLALLGRLGLRLAGLDMFVPRSHYIVAEHVDRAIASTLAAIELAADLGRVPMSVALPVSEMADDALSALIDAADGRSICIAVHGEDQLDAVRVWVDQIDRPWLRAAVDPAGLLAVSSDPVQVVQGLGKRLAVARLDDLAGDRTARCTVGDGELDVSGYRIALDLATSRVGPVVLDLRGQSRALESAVISKTAWEDAGFQL